MSYTQTPELSLDKAVPGSNQPFETASINSNWDKVDTAVAGILGETVASTIVKIDGGTA